MKEEIECACEFLCSNIRSAGGMNLSHEQLDVFRTILKELIVEKFTNHWYPDKPLRGNGYRCVNIDKDTRAIDPMLTKAAEVSDISREIFLSAFRFGLALWVDPGDVSYRNGHSSNIVSLFKKTTKSNDIRFLTKQQLPTSYSQYKSMYSNDSIINGLTQWNNQNTSSYPLLTNKQLKQLLQQRRHIDRFHWTNPNYYVPKQVTEVY